MNTRNVFLSLAAGCLMATLTCCSGGDDDDPTPNPNPGGEVNITGVSGGPFWGETLTIQGTGFSAVKSENTVQVVPSLSFEGCGLNLTSAGGDVEILAASTTAIQIKIPYKQYDHGGACGPGTVKIEVTVGGKKATIENVKFIGLPYVDNFLYHYGWFDVPSVTRIGDSVMIAGGLRGSNARDSQYWNQLTFTIDGVNVPIKYRTIGLESGWAFFMPPSEFARPSDCNDETDGWEATARTFTFSLPNGMSASRQLFVQNMPTISAGCAQCPDVASIQAGTAVNEWIIQGNYVSYLKEVAFAPTCGGATQSIMFFQNNEHEIRFQLPLSILADGCSYGVSIRGHCDESFPVGTVGM